MATSSAASSSSSSSSPPPPSLPQAPLSRNNDSLYSAGRVKSIASKTGSLSSAGASKQSRRRSIGSGYLTTGLLGFCLMAAILQMVLYQPPDLLHLQHPQLGGDAQRQQQGQAILSSLSSIQQQHGPLHNLHEWKVSHHIQSQQQNGIKQPQNSIADASLDSTTTAATSTTQDEVFREKDPPGEQHKLLSLLQRSGLDVTTQTLEESQVVLPPWEHITALYGELDTPIVHGMETCEAYRTAVPEQRRYAAVAGMFNTGTNAMMFHLEKNLKLAHRWQVPWGKHRVEAVRLNHTAPGMQGVVQEDCLPVVLIRDPFHWMQSMCKSPYAARWKHARQRHCPNLVPTPEDLQTLPGVTTEEGFPVKVVFDKNQIIHWKSLVHLWSDWYQQYVEADYPRLIVRFEDMLLNAPDILQRIAECAGTTVNQPFQFQMKSAKAHGSHTDFVKALSKTINATARIKSMTQQDLAYAAQELDAKLLELFQYTLPHKLAHGNTTTTIS